MGVRLIIAIVALLASCGLNGVIVAFCCEFGRLARDRSAQAPKGALWHSTTRGYPGAQLARAGGFVGLCFALDPFVELRLVVVQRKPVTSEGCATPALGR